MIKKLAILATATVLLMGLTGCVCYDPFFSHGYGHGGGHGYHHGHHGGGGHGGYHCP
jgi:hypothetical protein